MVSSTEGPTLASIAPEVNMPDRTVAMPHFTWIKNKLIIKDVQLRLVPL
jgi:hypothetical protein